MSRRASAARLFYARCIAALIAALLTHAALAHEDQAVRLKADTLEYPLAPAVTYLEDSQHKLDLEAVRKAHADGLFQRSGASGEFNLGYSASAYWLAVTLVADPDAPREWLLEIAFPSLDHVEVYAPEPAGYRKFEAGDLKPFSARPLEHRNFVFPLTLTPRKVQTLYVRVISQGSLTVPMHLWEPRAFGASEQYGYSALALYFGMLLALLLYNFLLYLSLRERIFLAYVAFVAFMAFGQASYNGFGNQFLWPEWPAWGNIALPSSMAAAGFFSAVFTRMFLNTRDISKVVDRAIIVLAVAFAFVAISPLFLSYRFAAIAISICALIFSALAVGAGWYCLLRGQAGARYFLLAWTVLLVGGGILALRNLSWVPTNWFTTNAMLIGSALEMLLLSFALADRIHLLRREKDQAQALALQAHQTMVEALQQSEQELEARVEKRTHELAETNARLLESEQQLQHMVYHDPLTGLANRVLLYDRIQHALAQSSRHGAFLAVLMVDLDGFKMVNDRYGHDVGDQLLVAVANRLRASVREADTVARFGGDEFVIALETIHHLQDAVLVSTKLLTELERAFALGDRELSVSASIGIAIFPDHGSDANTLIKQADEAMYRAKQAGRNAYRLAGA